MLPKFLLILVAILIAAYGQEDHHKYKNDYEAYKKLHNKNHHPSEHDERLKLWAKRHKWIEEHNASGKYSFKIGHNHLSDLTEEEKEHLAGHRPSSLGSSSGGRARENLRNDNINPSTLPLAFDWRKRGSCVGPIKDQSPCGSCWAMAAMATIEFTTCRSANDGEYIALSEQDVIDCAERSKKLPNDMKCDEGGNPIYAMEYLTSAGGPSSLRDYPYIGKRSKGVCKEKPSVASLVRYGTLPSNVAAMKSAIMKYGPITTSIFSSDKIFDDEQKLMHHYKSGVYSSASCKGKKQDHSINIVGWGRTKSGVDYWIVRNSWGTTWGEKGYLNMEMGVDMCGIESSEHYYAVAGPNISRRSAPRNQTALPYPANHGRPVQRNFPLHGQRAGPRSGFGQRPLAAPRHIMG